MLAKKIAVLVSGGGTNLQALIDHYNNSEIKKYEICAVISNNENAYALTRAKNNGIKTYTLNKQNFKSNEEFENEIKNIIFENEISLIVLAGFMYILSKDFTKTFENKIINVHPSLIPAFCGKGFYGLNVHKAVLDYGVKVTGATVHFVNEIPDGGKIIAQKPVFVKEDDTPEILQKRVMEEAEWDILPKAIDLVIDNLII